MRCRYRLSYLWHSFSQRIRLAPLWPLRNVHCSAPSFNTCRRARFSFIPFQKSLVFQSFCLCGFFFICTSILSSSIYLKLNSARRNYPCTKLERKYAPTRARQCKRADTVVKRQHVVEYLRNSKQMKKSKSVRQEMQPLTNQLKLVLCPQSVPAV